MLFSETNRAWQPIPEWADFLIRFGFGWPHKEPGTRRVALVSMPCDSSAAALITLGAMIRDFGRAEANDIDGHYDALLRHAKQFLESCSCCELRVCDPQRKKCGHIKKASGRLRSLLFPRRSYEISDRTDVLQKKLAWRFQIGHRPPVFQWPTPQNALNWHVDGEPPPQLNEPDGTLSHEPYAHIVAGSIILPDNLQKSYSGLCLAGRAGGKRESQEICESVRFRDHACSFSLSELLTIHGWSTSTVSRVSFFNSRTEQIDRTSFFPSLAVTDGDSAFLRLTNRHEFQQSDIVAVIDRTISRGQLEAVGNKMAELHQWYVPDTELLGSFPVTPRGIAVSILRRR